MVLPYVRLESISRVILFSYMGIRSLNHLMVTWAKMYPNRNVSVLLTAISIGGHQIPTTVYDGTRPSSALIGDPLPSPSSRVLPRDSLVRIHFFLIFLPEHFFGVVDLCSSGSRCTHHLPWRWILRSRLLGNHTSDMRHTIARQLRSPYSSCPCCYKSEEEMDALRVETEGLEARLAFTDWEVAIDMSAIVALGKGLDLAVHVLMYP